MSDVSVERKGGRAIVVASPKGGVGKSTVSANLALVLAQSHPLDVVLVDLDAQFGDVASLLDINPDRTVVDAVAALGDPVLLKTCLAKHPSGLIVLPAPASPTAAEFITIDQAKKLVEDLKALFPIVVIDTASGLNDPGVGALEASDDAVFVTSMDVSSLRGLRREIDVLDALSVAPRRHLVVNFADKSSGIEVADIENVLGVHPSAVLPRDNSVVFANNRGVALVLERKRGEVAKQLAAFAEKLAPAPKVKRGLPFRRRKEHKETKP
ncbi:MAG TPA: AAA family ATPase [Aeromicrobium sp.]|nr:AAA family ATPase [Aeromicrobium sp.]